MRYAGYKKCLRMHQKLQQIWLCKCAASQYIIVSERIRDCFKPIPRKVRCSELMEHCAGGLHEESRCDRVEKRTEIQSQQHIGWKWQEDRKGKPIHGARKYNTMYLASLNIKTTIDVARPKVTSKLLQEGELFVVMLAEMQDLREESDFESCKVNFLYSRCTRQGIVEASTLKWVRDLLWSVEESWKELGLGLCFVGWVDRDCNAACCGPTASGS